MSQINLRLPENLQKKAEKYVKENSYKNIQELAMQALREKITHERIDLIEKLVELSIKTGQIYGEEELMKLLKKKRGS